MAEITRDEIVEIIYETVKTYPNGGLHQVDVAADAILARLGDGWRPIESAPKDGSIMDLWCVEGAHEMRITNAYWSGKNPPRKSKRYEDGWWAPGQAYDGGPGILYSTPTHCRPLPAPPKESA